MLTVAKWRSDGWAHFLAIPGEAPPAPRAPRATTLPAGVIRTPQTITVIEGGVAVLETEDGVIRDPLVNLLAPRNTGFPWEDRQVEPDSWAGRAAFRARFPTKEFDRYADVYFDAETGVILRMESQGEGEWFTEVEINDELPDDEFEWDGPTALGEFSGRVWIAADHPDAVHAHWDVGHFFHQVAPAGIDLDTALAWARERSGKIHLRIGETEYSAGVQDLPGRPSWPG